MTGAPRVREHVELPFGSRDRVRCEKEGVTPSLTDVSYLCNVSKSTMVGSETMAGAQTTCCGLPEHLLSGTNALRKGATASATRS